MTEYAPAKIVKYLSDIQQFLLNNKFSKDKNLTLKYSSDI